MLHLKISIKHTQKVYKLIPKSNYNINKLHKMSTSIKPIHKKCAYMCTCMNTYIQIITSTYTYSQNYLRIFS